MDGSVETVNGPDTGKRHAPEFFSPVVPRLQMRTSLLFTMASYLGSRAYMSLCFRSCALDTSFILNWTCRTMGARGEEIKGRLA